MNDVTKEEVRKAVFKILETVHGISDLNIMFADIHQVVMDLMLRNEKSGAHVEHMLAKIGHQVRTQMCGIQGFAELLTEELGDKNGKEKAMNIFIAAKRSIDMLDNLIKVLPEGITIDSDDEKMNDIDFPSLENSTKFQEISKGQSKRKKSSGKSLPNVLIVEDNLVNIQLLMIYIRRYCNIFSTQNAKSAIQLTEEQQFDAILMDIHLGPGMDGIQALRAIREQPGNEQIPIIAVTGYAGLGDREKFLNDGFTEYIKKPIDRGEIRRIFERLFNKED